MKSICFALIPFLIVGCQPAQVTDQPVAPVKPEDELPTPELNPPAELPGLPKDIPNDPVDLDIQIEINVLDCGVSRSLNTVGLVNDALVEADEALVCLGNALIDNCRQARADIETSNGGTIFFEINGLTAKGCMIRTQYGDAEQIQLDEQKGNANKFADCPIDIDRMVAAFPETASDAPAAFAVSVYLMIGFESMNPNTKCIGDLYDVQ